MNTLKNDQFLNNFEYLKRIIDENNKNLIDSDDVKNIISELKESLAITQVLKITARSNITFLII